jgi:DNA-binding response OmpR family regulator
MNQKKIFICDDDKGITDMLAMILEYAGFEPIIETDSVNAFEKIRESRPDLLIVDLWMPIISGDQLIRQIRRCDELKKTFILCISASRNGQDVALEAGANQFLPKPFDIDELITIINNIDN